jgi:hypothetical protein
LPESWYRFEIAIAWASLLMGTPLTIASSDIDKLYDRYQNVYGQ